MQRYITIRLIQAVFVLLAVSVIVFGLARASGNPVVLMLPIDAGPEDYERLTRFWGLDKPLHIQYLKFLGNAGSGGLRRLHQSGPAVLPCRWSAAG